MSFQRVIDGIFRVEGTCSVAYGPARWTAAGGESHFYPELPKTVSASISSSAISKIRTEIKDALKGLECGGFLVAHLDSLDRIVAATGEGPDTIVSRTSVELLFQPLEDLAEIAPHLSLAGDWHLHVEGSDMPSSTDRRAWVTGARRADPWGAPIPNVPRPPPGELERLLEPNRHLDIGAWTCRSGDGDPLDLDLAVSALCQMVNAEARAAVISTP